ncbi:MAG TPA: hypothetical protein VMW69_04495 [Spirochaetia bacterium]|nr:hypothetical protein [Spirochaetia bacterium]
MKRTDIERKERELKRAEKKAERLAAGGDHKDEVSVGAFIDKLYSLFFHDETKIYNTKHSVEILEVLEDAQANFSEQELDTIIRKAIRKSKVKEKELAFQELKELIQ